MGNICRSPTAEYLFRQRMKSRDVKFSSAGLGALVGSPMDATALQLLKAASTARCIARIN
jgi:protein-tyrosine phosphatase